MNVTAFVGTQRKQGLVSSICQEVLKGAADEGADTELVNLYDYSINHCLGCWSCYTENRCFQDDEFEILYEKLKKSSVIILGSPVYCGNVPGIMKDFFDRHTGHALYNPPCVPDFHLLPPSKKLQQLIRGIRNFGTKDKDIWGKFFILVMASTLPFPITLIKRQTHIAMRAMDFFVDRFRGKRIAKLMYTDSLLKFNPVKEKRILKKAYRIGQKATIKYNYHKEVT
ncbi:flavodoxin family protein [Acidobacteriota bacterium]